MRTNIEIDDRLMQDALRLTGLKTKRECVDRALRDLVAHHSLLKKQAQLRRLYGALPSWEGNLQEMRKDP